MEDIITNTGNGVQAYGSVGQRLLQSGMNINSLRTNATLSKDEWKRFDDAVIAIAEERLAGIADLMNAGLTFNVGNALGTTIVEWETISDFTDASITMDGNAASQEDRAVFDLKSVPLPVFHKDARLSARVLEASRSRGDALDTTYIELATRKVVESMEKVLFQGTSAIRLGSAQIYGYTTHPQRNTVVGGANWAASGTTGENILTDVLSMVQAAEDDKYFGPYWLYVPSNFSSALEEDFKANSDKSVRQRLSEIDSIQAIRKVDFLPASNVVLVQATRDVVDLVDGFQPTPVEWSSGDGMTLFFKVMSIMVPRIKNDADNKSGVVHMTF